MFETLDILRALSLFLGVATLILTLHFWRNYPRYQPQFFMVAVYLIHGIAYYATLLIGRVTLYELLTNNLYNDWGAVLRFHSYVTWFFVALLFFRLRKR